MEEYYKKRYLVRRIFARFIDFSIIMFLLSLTGGPTSMVILIYIIYNLLFSIFLRGLTIGRFLCRIGIEAQDKIVFRLLWREALYYLLGWVILIEFFFTTRPFVHERFSHTKISVK